MVSTAIILRSCHKILYQNWLIYNILCFGCSRWRSSRVIVRGLLFENRKDDAMTRDELIELEKRAIALARKIDVYEFRNRDEYGNWKSEKASKVYDVMRRELARLDANFGD